MDVLDTGLDGVLLFRPTPFHDDRGFFSRTFDASIAAAHGIDASAFLQDSQSRTREGVVRGLHGRSGRGESKLMRCARGAIHLAIVDAREQSPTFGVHEELVVDDREMVTVHVPAGMVVGFQALTDHADVCYRIDRPHVEGEAIAVRYDDPGLRIAWPLPVEGLSTRDRAAPSWAELVARMPISATLRTAR
jgi:dTDP-4-dehydrorhamnose 3,5-epimerase